MYCIYTVVASHHLNGYKKSSYDDEAVLRRRGRRGVAHPFDTLPSMFCVIKFICRCSHFPNPHHHRLITKPHYLHTHHRAIFIIGIRTRRYRCERTTSSSNCAAHIKCNLMFCGRIA